MAFIPQITCRHCGNNFSALYNRCPNCGTRRVRESARTPATTASARQGTPANERAKSNAQFQLIFGCVLLLAVVVSVIILVSTAVRGGGAGKESVTASAAPVVNPAPPTEEVTVQQQPETQPTPTPTPTEEVSSIQILFLGNTLPDDAFTCKVGATVDLDPRVYPASADAVVNWSTTDSSVITVNSDGVVTGMSTGVAYVVARAGSQEARVRVVVP